jgi:Rrf2 family protein
MQLELTHRASYALRAATLLAHASEATWTSATTIARATGVSRAFVPQVLADLVRADIVETRVGRAGGYRLARPRRDITLLSVIEAAEGDPRRRTCVLRGTECPTDPPLCGVHDVFAQAQEAVISRLAAATLADV